MQRGVRRQEIFTTEDDYLCFLRFLKKELEIYGYTLHAYCLMTNHYHLLVETSDQEVWKFMKCLSQNYARYYNSKYSYNGHLFEGRYVSSLVKDDAYFLQVSRYIHLNPVRAYLCKSAEQYRFSSYNCYVNQSVDKITSVQKTLGYFGDDPVSRYREFVESLDYKYLSQDECIRKGIGEDVDM